MKMLLGQLQTKNPQMASQISNAMQNGANPQGLMKQMMGNVDNNQMQSVLSQARNLGVLYYENVDIKYHVLEYLN